MGCGGFGMMEDLLRSIARTGGSCGAPNVEEQIKLLYAKGQCDRETGAVQICGGNTIQF